MTEKEDAPVSPDRHSSDLLRLVPPVLRARGFRLYTQGGRRLVDLWQYGGAAVLGHTPAGVLREMKNTAERGLFAPMPHPLEGCLLKALARLFPRRVFRLYDGEASFRRALGRAGYPSDIIPLDMALFDTARPTDPDRETAGMLDQGLVLWRPFLEEPVPELFLPVLPLPWISAPWALALSPSLAAERDFPPSDIISPVVLAAAVRGVCDLIAAGDRANPRFPKLEEVLCAGPWSRRGIYLCYGKAPDNDSYGELFRHFLDQGFLLPPSRNLPAILPGVLSPGEEARLAKLLKWKP
jgi:hypothetical protein